MRKITLLFLLLFSTFIHAHNIIIDYQRIFLPVYTTEGNLLIAIRVFKMNDVPSFLVVNPTTLETMVKPINSLWHRGYPQIKKPGYFTQWNIASTLYYQLLNKNTAPPYPVENKGLTHTSRDKGNVLTIDLCPSSKPFEKTLFDNLVKLANESGKPVPITLAISGLWLIGHSDEFQWLLTQEKEKKLAITWANHSFSHAFYSDLPYSKNFLLLPGTNLDMEILLTEKYLLETGGLPSVFFRFPGLVSNKKIVHKIKLYGLIPLGADVWLAKQQEVTPGGIILVHGNGNEPQGIAILLPLLNQLIFLDIKSAF